MISAIGSLGTANAYSNGVSNTRPLSISPSRAVAAGRLVVVWYANHSVFSIFSPSDGYNFWRCRDSQGNVYSTIGAATDQRAFSKSGAASILFIAQLQTALSTSDTITVETINNFFGGENWARAMSVEEFSVGDGMRWAVGDGNWSTLVQGGFDPGAISSSLSAPDREVLYLHALGARGPNTDAYTWDSDYTQVAGDGTTGGSATENIHVRGGYRIATLSGNSDTVDVTSTTADRDYAQTMNVVCEVPAKPFPFNGILDDFNRADENPLDNGTWDTSAKAFGGAFGRIASNVGAGAGGSFWSAGFDGCLDVFATLSTVGGGLHLHYAASGDSSIPNMQGRGLAWLTAGHAAGTPGHMIQFGPSGNQGRVGNYRLVSWLDAANGYKAGMQRTKAGSGLKADHLWVDQGAGWEEVGAIFGPPSSGAGKHAIGFEDSSSRADDFGGGEFPCGGFIPQVYRRQYGVA